MFRNPPHVKGTIHAAADSATLSPPPPPPPPPIPSRAIAANAPATPTEAVASWKKMYMC